MASDYHFECEAASACEMASCLSEQEAESDPVWRHPAIMKTPSVLAFFINKNQWLVLCDGTLPFRKKAVSDHRQFVAEWHYSERTVKYLSVIAGLIFSFLLISQACLM